MTTAQALKAADETPVTVYGTIHKHIKDEMYQLQDQTGIIHVEIDHDLATPAQLLNPGKKSGWSVKWIHTVINQPILM